MKTLIVQENNIHSIKIDTAEKVNITHKYVWRIIILIMWFLVSDNSCEEVTFYFNIYMNIYYFLERILFNVVKNNIKFTTLTIFNSVALVTLKM